jgi:hypothetical protein
MAYVPLSVTDIQAGKPTKKEIFTRIRDNQESFNTDIEALKQTSTVDVFNVKFGGNISEYSLSEIADRVPVFAAPVGGTLVAFKITLLEASTSGTLEIDIEKSTDNGVNFNTLLNNPVEVTGTTVGSVSGTVDWISAASQDFNQGDLLRITITNVQVDQGEFHVSIYGEVS